MQLSRRSAAGLVAINAVVAAMPARLQGQQQPSQMQAPFPQQTGRPTMTDASGSRGIDDPGAMGRAMRDRMRISAERARNNDRRKRMLADTDKLLALSTELKADVEKASKDDPLPAMIRKAEEIEKLARDVQQRMKD